MGPSLQSKTFAAMKVPDLKGMCANQSLIMVLLVVAKQIQ